MSTQTILVGDCRAVLAGLPEKRVHVCVTSPPYFGLRDYGTGSWDGGDPACGHVAMAVGMSDTNTLGPSGGLPPTNAANVGRVLRHRDVCGKCGATRTDRQIGMEADPAAYVAAMVEVFRGVWRVLRDDGTLWLVLGDGFRDKQLMMMPARVALALQADGWYLRSDCIWSKKAPMPESVIDRCTSAHEHIFLLSKRRKYSFDAEAIAEPAVSDHDSGNGYARPEQLSRGGRGQADGWTRANNPTRNCRNVWHLSPEPYPGQHFATFPSEIPRRAIKAGSSQAGACGNCGAPWMRVGERTPMVIRNGPKAGGYGSRTTDCLSGTMIAPATSVTTGWAPTCRCEHAGPPVPCVVLDPFVGSGTTLLVANQLGRDGIGIDLNPDYAAQAEARVRDECPMFTTVNVEGAA